MDIAKHPDDPKKYKPPRTAAQSTGAIADVLYRNVFRRSSSFILAIVVGAFFFERAFDKTGNEIFERLNKGKLWKDIKYKYEGKGAETEDQENPAEQEAGAEDE